MSTQEFGSIEQFLAHLTAAELALKQSSHRALDRAAQIIEEDAKAQFGEYQDQVGPFPAWTPLADATKANRVREGFPEDEPLLRTGDLRDSISREVDGNEAAVGSTSDVMVYQELGTSRIPPRPVLGPAALKNKEEIQHVLGESTMHALEYGSPGELRKLPD